MDNTLKKWQKPAWVVIGIILIVLVVVSAIKVAELAAKHSIFSKLLRAKTLQCGADSRD